MKRFLTAVTALIFVASGNAYGCSCAAPVGDVRLAVSQAYKGASSVVVAQAVTIKKQQIRQAWMEKNEAGAQGEVTRFFTVDSWKGEHGSEFSVKTMTEPGMCGVSFEEGRSYLLYLYGPDKDGYYSASICSRTVKLEGAKEDLKILNGMARK